MLLERHMDTEDCRRFLPSIRAVSTEQSICAPFQEILILCKQMEKKGAFSLMIPLA